MGLIEILVALVIISIGFLAAARMQVEGMRFSQGAYHRSQAYFMASDMIDRMRANIEGVRAGSYDDVTTASGLTDPGCDAVQCLPAKIAEQDRYDWSVLIHPPADEDGSASDRLAVLPTIGTTVPEARVLGSDGRYTVTVTWPTVIDKEQVDDSLAISFVTEF